MPNSLRLALAAVLAAAACTAQTTSVNGQVTNSVTREPIARAHVLLFNLSRKYGAFTDAQGNFSFENVAPDSYQTTADKIDFLARPNFIVDESKLLKLEAGVRHGSIMIELIPAGSISGRVVDQNGEPMDGIAVKAVQGRVPSGEVRTDEHGEFRMIALPPGKYRIKATKDDFPLPPEIRTDGTREVHYASTWYPGVVDPASGTKVEVRAGSETDGIEIRMATAPIVGIRGKIDGMPAEGRDLTLMVSRTGDPDSDSGASIEPAPDGTFEIWRLDPGRYRVWAEGHTPGDRQFQTAPEEVEIAGSNINNLQLTVMPPATLNGRVEFEEEQTTERLPKLSVVFNDIDAGTGSRPAEIDGNRFHIEELPPGRFHVELGEKAYVKSIRLGQTEIDGAILDLRHGAASGQLVLMLSTIMGGVSGAVQNEEGTPTQAWLSLIPQEAIAENFSYSMIQSKADGTYSFDGVPPGKYKLLASEDPNGLNFPDDDEQAEEVEIHAGEKTTKDLVVTNQNQQ